MSCKTCNSTLKKNLFPIEGTRDSGSTDPSKMKSEKALLIYPIGDFDTDPQELIAFEACLLSLRRLQDMGDEGLWSPLKSFAWIAVENCSNCGAQLVRHLFVELDGRANATTNTKREKTPKSY